ncbi:hypothetical protein CP533_5958 [Ophiocordyceps camponoti-saundersi (nom. inval.)]|nr:hypothetical protein CP533_5958 [Ophiocordyceps camponoti-saundersi (nom. inval.)]
MAVVSSVVVLARAVHAGKPGRRLNLQAGGSPHAGSDFIERKRESGNFWGRELRVPAGLINSAPAAQPCISYLTLRFFFVCMRKGRGGRLFDRAFPRFHVRFGPIIEPRAPIRFGLNVKPGGRYNACQCDGPNGLLKCSGRV